MSKLDVDGACASVRERVRGLLDDLPNLRRQVGPADEVGRHLLDRVLVASDFATGCALLGQERLAGPTASVTRSLVESLIGTYWASLDDANGRKIMDAGRREAMRIMRLNLVAGHARVRHRKAGRNHTGQVLRDARMSEAARLPRFDHMAKEAGIGKVYDVTYGMLSLLSHAGATEVLAARGQDDAVHGHLHAAAAIVRCLHLIVSNRVRSGRVTPKDEIASVLKVSL